MVRVRVRAPISDSLTVFFIVRLIEFVCYLLAARCIPLISSYYAPFHIFSPREARRCS